ncbi:MAG: hypothetical protein PSN37_02970 [Alphaproteobacteria bacterium]|nr:hypothetical protein [Alphaproteobacteria bacterium]
MKGAVHGIERHLSRIMAPRIIAKMTTLIGEGRTLFLSASHFSSALGGALQGGASALFSAGAHSRSDESIGLLVKGLDRERKHLLGFKTALSPAQTKMLSKKQEKISLLEAKASGSAGLSASEHKERLQLYREAYAIMGKEYVDVKGNARLKALTGKVDDLLAAPLRGAQKQRHESLERLRSRALERVQERPKSEAAKHQLRNISTQLKKLETQREIKALSSAEKREYDRLVDQINDSTKSEILLPSRKRLRLEQLTASIRFLEMQGALSGKTPSPNITPGRAAALYMS